MPAVKKQSGFTLIEIIVSITLIPLVWFAIFISLSVNAMLISQAKHRAQAVFIAQQNLDRMRANGYSSLVVVNNQNVTIDTRGTTSTGDDLVGTMGIALGPAFGGNHYKQVTVTINWNEKMVGGPDRALTESLATIISDDPAG